MSEINPHEITEKKLNSSDNYRAQVQFNERKQKLIIAGPYNFMADFRPVIAKRVRNFAGDQTLMKCEQEFLTMIETDSKVIELYWNWFNMNCHDDRIKRDMRVVVSGILKKQSISSY